MRLHQFRDGRWRCKIALGRRARLRKATNIRHKGKKLEDILDAHEKYHKGHPGGERADLSGADLSRMDFKKRDLTGALFVGCRLRGADFRGSNIGFAALT